MDFFPNQWAPGRRPFQPEFQFRAAPELRRSPKVVQIPVRCPGEEETRSASALMIQKVLRGHLVRKSVRKIIGIKREVDAIETRVSEKEVVDLIRQKDGKERLNVNEALMALLFKLDAVSVCGDSGIRICRKAVIRKAIALQEKVDSIASVQTQENDEELQVENPLEKSTDSDQLHGESISNSASTDEEEEEYEFVEQNLAADPKGDSCSLMEEDEKETGAVALPEKAADGGGEGRELEEIVQQNGKLMRMMVELLESNAAQAKMITSLSHRLEQLEKTVMFDTIEKIRRRKKKHSP